MNWQCQIIYYCHLFQLFIISLEFEIGVVANNATAEVSVDQYHRYKVSEFFSNQTRRALCAAYEKKIEIQLTIINSIEIPIMPSLT